MNKGVCFAGGCLLLLCAVFALWPDGSATPAAIPSAEDGCADGASESAPFLHANWNTTAPAREPAERVPTLDPEREPELKLPERLKGVEVALPVPEKRK